MKVLFRIAEARLALFAVLLGWAGLAQDLNIDSCLRVLKTSKDDAVKVILLSEIGGEKGKKFKYKQLEELLLGCAHLPMETIKEQFDQTFDRWKGNLEQVRRGMPDRHSHLTPLSIYRNHQNQPSISLL